MMVLQARGGGGGRTAANKISLLVCMLAVASFPIIICASCVYARGIYTEALGKCVCVFLCECVLY